MDNAEKRAIIIIYSKKERTKTMDFKITPHTFLYMDNSTQQVYYYHLLSAKTDSSVLDDILNMVMKEIIADTMGSNVMVSQAHVDNLKSTHTSLALFEGHHHPITENFHSYADINTVETLKSIVNPKATLKLVVNNQ